jgi:hypothetical protein
MKYAYQQMKKAKVCNKQKRHKYHDEMGFMALLFL